MPDQKLRGDPEGAQGKGAGDRTNKCTCPHCQAFLRRLDGEPEWKPDGHLLTCPESGKEDR